MATGLKAKLLDELSDLTVVADSSSALTIDLMSMDFALITADSSASGGPGMVIPLLMYGEVTSILVTETSVPITLDLLGLRLTVITPVAVTASTFLPRLNLLGAG